mmetsp:Transcript_10674/g.27161  ORF Transcript_10674/g.27161 Transcript_10674/m.27161 type:complete len:297 (-) Transcript_10674:14-904(-)
MVVPAAGDSAVGFIGVGIMGAGMVGCLLKEGRRVVVWNRDATKTKALQSAYPELCTVAASAAAVVESCDVTWSMLSTLEASEAVFPQVVGAISPGKCIVDCATLTPDRMTSMSDQVVAAGGRFLEAPVSGSKVPAEQGQLIFLCAGDEPLYESVAAELEIMGKASFFFGPVGAGTKMKLVVNMIMGEQLAAIGEGLALCDAAGLSQTQLIDVLKLGVMNSPLLGLKGPKMVAGDFAPHFPLTHAQKDMQFSLGLADAVGVDLPVAKAANARYAQAKQAGRGDDDFAAVITAQTKQG